MNTIWMYWDQGWDHAPTCVQECAKSWERQNPTYNVVRLSRDTLADHVTLSHPVQNITAQISLQAKSDLLRLCLLVQKGGVWADATLYCAKPLDGWVHHLNTAQVAIFTNPGPDRLVASWFMAAPANSPLIMGWLDEFLTYLRTLRNPKTPKGGRKIVQKICQSMWSGSVEKTRHWKTAFMTRFVSITPYFMLHYSFAWRAMNNPDFAKLIDSLPDMDAAPPHRLQFAAKAGDDAAVKAAINDPNIPVHKLNWRHIDQNPKWNNWFAQLRDRQGTSL